MKIPAFVSHYSEHKALNGNMTILNFLRIHYANGDQKDADHAKDMQLPFKTHDNCSVQINLAAPPSVFTIATHKITHTEEQKQYFPHDVFVSSSFFANIWQPPKFC